MNIRPMYDRVLIRCLKQEQPAFGIYLPEVKDKPREGEIVATGEGRLRVDGSVCPLRLQVGEKVIFPRHGGVDIKYNEEEYVIVGETDVLARLG